MTFLPEGKLYIDGQLRDAANGAKYEDISPWTGEVVAYAADASAEDMEEAIAAARRAFDHSDWPTNSDKRLALVHKLAELMKANRQRLVDIAIHETGAAMGAVNMANVDGPLNHFDKLFEIYGTIEWEKAMLDKEVWGSVHRRLLVKEPAGVVGAIIPWNVPLYITVGKVIPALLLGCTVILKPAPDTPLMSTIIGELAAEAGFPAGVLNVVSGKEPALLGEILVTDPRVDVISFTGSTGVGRRIMEIGAPTLKRLFLELGGKSAAIIFEDAPNFAEAVGQSIVCYHAGQGCATITRLLVPESRYDEAVTVLEHAYDAYAQLWGKAEDPTNFMGPLISQRQRDRVMGYIEAGKSEGARLIAGGQIATDKGGGFFIEPTCFVDVTNDMTIAREEIFGPVLVVIPFKDDEDAIRIANDSEYGLSGSVVSGDEARAVRVAKRIRTGTVGVNGGMSMDVDLPFGGYKQSGLGKEWGLEGFEEYLETKVIATRA
ncbi:aldehyde dehydrogenase family protein [Novosphingobium sp. G106]|uniref:aldehyde dehydrogenase family protein n=1 Tax=Novosphingobium sp. G106 TaxID=2849500 RepID=UPI001C2DDD39|nr:aldehyde dehydrogenase family protein [Novosphingobium sp. G106]MBV1686135.1 aldehyde dehydrogenase family protein [Novosphingobium sp. G106]